MRYLKGRSDGGVRTAKIVVAGWPGETAKSVAASDAIRPVIGGTSILRWIDPEKPDCVSKVTVELPDAVA